MGSDRPSENPVVRSLQLLTTGWGFNFYNDKNRARADDLLIREKVAHHLSEATAALSILEGGYRRRFVPSPTRENPLPPAAAMDKLRAIGQLKARIADLGVRIRGASVPTQDKIWFRLRDERTLLLQLLASDESLIQNANRIADLARSLTAEAWNADSDGSSRSFDEPIFSLEEALRTRMESLLIPTL